MSKTLSDTAAIAARQVPQTCNPDYSGFRESCYKTAGSQTGSAVGKERPAHAIQVLHAKRPGS